MACKGSPPTLLILLLLAVVLLQPILGSTPVHRRHQGHKLHGTTLQQQPLALGETGAGLKLKKSILFGMEHKAGTAMFISLALALLRYVPVEKRCLAVFETTPNAASPRTHFLQRFPKNKTQVGSNSDYCKQQQELALWQMFRLQQTWTPPAPVDHLSQAQKQAAMEPMVLAVWDGSAFIPSSPQVCAGVHAAQLCELLPLWLPLQPFSCSLNGL